MNFFNSFDFRVWNQMYFFRLIFLNLHFIFNFCAYTVLIFLVNMFQYLSTYPKSKTPILQFTFEKFENVFCHQAEVLCRPPPCPRRRPTTTPRKGRGLHARAQKRPKSKQTNGQTDTKSFYLKIEFFSSEKVSFF